uniref:BHLH domain-containing protein n=1 Tax=Biomphalaria glabrata TaxID=6526 RepID=A0A2C9LJI0_BIOGL
MYRTTFEEFSEGSQPAECTGVALLMDQNRRPAETNYIDPYSPMCQVPLPGHWSDYNNVRRRNQRERDRVRYVNESYETLKQRLPLDNNRRISKVQTLRYAVEYIRRLQKILTDM